MKKESIILSILTLSVIGLCGCKGRTASTPEPTGDTVEVVVSRDDPSATVDAESDSLFNVDPEDARNEEAPAYHSNYSGESPADATGQVSPTSEATKRRASGGSVSIEKAI